MRTTDDVRALGREYADIAAGRKEGRKERNAAANLFKKRGGRARSAGQERRAGWSKECKRRETMYMHNKLFEGSMKKWEEEWTAGDTPPLLSLYKIFEYDGAFHQSQEYEYSLCALESRVARWPHHTAESRALIRECPLCGRGVCGGVRASCGFRWSRPEAHHYQRVRHPREV